MTGRQPNVRETLETSVRESEVLKQIVKNPIYRGVYQRISPVLRDMPCLEPYKRRIPDYSRDSCAETNTLQCAIIVCETEVISLFVLAENLETR